MRRAAVRDAWYAASRMNEDTSTARYLDAAPTDEETARRDVLPYRNLDTTARLEAMAALLRSMDTLLGGREPLRAPEDEEFWRHWRDPSLGRPR